MRTQRVDIIILGCDKQGTQFVRSPGPESDRLVGQSNGLSGGCGNEVPGE